MEDKTIKNEREIAAEQSLQRRRKNAQDDRKGQAGNVKQGANAKIINDLRTSAQRTFGAAHCAAHQD